MAPRSPATMTAQGRCPGRVAPSSSGGHAASARRLTWSAWARRAAAESCSSWTEKTWTSVPLTLTRACTSGRRIQVAQPSVGSGPAATETRGRAESTVAPGVAYALAAQRCGEHVREGGQGRCAGRTDLAGGSAAAMPRGTRRRDAVSRPPPHTCDVSTR